MVVLLALLAASYTFMVQAHYAAARTDFERLQARLAAQSGIERAVVMLREFRNDPAKWYDNPDAFRAALVYTDSKDALVEKPNWETFNPNAPAAWRFNLVAANPDNRATIRYGLTDECGKLNINNANETQLRRFFTLAIPEDTQRPVNIDVLVDSLLDWRKPGDQARPNGAKNEYYKTLRPPYQCKGAPFATVEELLMVRGFNAWILYGEDYNGNGMLDSNEDDGDTNFPPDNADGRLFPGIAPYLTLWSNEMNTSADMRPRINLNNKDAQELQEALEQEFRPELISYVMEVRGAGGTFNSVMNLIPAPPPEPEEEEGESAEESTSQPSTSRPTTSRGAGGFDGGPTSRSTDQNQSGKSRRPLAFKNLTATVPPGTYDDLPLILDRLTVNPMPFLSGRINVSTAPREVLATLEDLTLEEIEAIGAARANLKPEERTTPAWLLTHNAISENRFRQILDKITTHSSVFTIESVGYADHCGASDRLRVVLEMRGPMPQVLYTRNLSSLGPAYRPHGIEQRGGTEQVK
jgi:type II secretory pathway component PulK